MGSDEKPQVIRGKTKSKVRACLMKLATPLSIYVNALICATYIALPSLIFKSYAILKSCKSKA